MYTERVYFSSYLIWNKVLKSKNPKEAVLDMIVVKYATIEFKYQIMSFIKYSWYIYIQGKWSVISLDQIEKWIKEQNIIQLYKWNLRLKVFIRDFLTPSRDIFLLKLLKNGEAFEDKELTELFLIYFYDFYEWDSEFDEESEELESLRKERK